MSNKTLIIGAVIIFAGLMIFVGFYNRNSPAASGGGVRGSQSSPGSYQAAASGGVTSKNLAPDFTLSKLDGGTISLAEFRGKKPVVVDFWASWCPNCRRDMSNLNRFYENYKDRLEVIAVNLQESEGTVRNFIESRGFSFPVALDPYGGAGQAFGIRYTNTHFLIDKNGKIVREIPGDIREADFLSLLQ